MKLAFDAFLTLFAQDFYHSTSYHSLAQESSFVFQPIIIFTCNLQ